MSASDDYEVEDAGARLLCTECWTDGNLVREEVSSACSGGAGGKMGTSLGQLGFVVVGVTWIYFLLVATLGLNAVGLLLGSWFSADGPTC